MNKKLAISLVAILLFGIIGGISLLGSSYIIFLIGILVLFVGLFAWVIPLILKRADPRVWVITGFIILLGLLFPTSLLMSGNDVPLSTLPGITIFFLPSLALVNAAFLLYSGLTDAANSRLKRVSLGLCVLLIVKTLYNLYMLTLWDNTYDPLGYLWLILPVFAVLLSGLMLSMDFSGRKKFAGPLYTILATVLLISISALAQHVDFHQETERRAERIVQAIESYEAREGDYPESLSQLTPWYILSLPKPMIIYGQDWCYQSGENYYRLGYIDREHWSDPRMIGHIYKSVGEVPDTQPMCMAEFNALQDHQYSYWKEIK
ncbi:MAG TPA: hypothetical protein VJ987_12795 [Anaerolineales bacterium]|nr:hypothetical protein [Anaerolineales bacterium]